MKIVIILQKGIRFNITPHFYQSKVMTASKFFYTPFLEMINYHLSQICNSIIYKVNELVAFSLYSTIDDLIVISLK